MHDSLHPDRDTPGGLSGIEIPKLKVECPRGFDNLLDWCIGRLVHTALIAGEMDDARRPRTAGADLGTPEHFVGVAAVGRWPDVRNIEGTTDAASPDLLPEEPVHEVIIHGKILHPEHRIAVDDDLMDWLFGQEI